MSKKYGNPNIRDVSSEPSAARAVSEEINRRFSKSSAETSLPINGASGFVTAAWIKKRYSIANSTLYLWIANKRLPAPVKIGSRAVRFRLDDILAFEAGLGHASEKHQASPPSAHIMDKSERSVSSLPPDFQARG